MSELDNRRKLWRASWMSGGVAPSAEVKAWWLPRWDALDKHGLEQMNPPVKDYAFKRALGWQAEGADKPKYGEYADPPTPYHSVPVFPDEPSGETNEPAAPPPAPTPEPPSLLGEDFERLFESMDKIIAGLEKLVAVNGELVERLDYVKQHGIRVTFR